MKIERWGVGIVALCLSLFSADRVYGIHNMKINGGNSATVTTADSFYISADFEAGSHTAKVTLYYDANRNGVLDAGENWILKCRLIDGNFDDTDETVNCSIIRIATRLQ